MRKFLLLLSFCFLMLTPLSATEVVENFSTNIWGLATSGQGNAGTGKYTSTTGYTYNVSWGNSCYWYKDYSAILLGKTAGSYIELPAFEGTVTKIAISNSSNCSTKVGVKITDDAGTQIVAAKIFSDKSSTYIYDIPADKQVAGQVLRIVLSNANNVQITKIAITIEDGSSTAVAKPTTTATDKMLYGAEYTISTTTSGATLYYCVDGTDTYTAATGNSNSVTLNAPTEGESFTIKAYAKADGLSDSETLVKTVTLYDNTVANIAAFLDAADTDEAKTFSNSVTAIYQNGKNLWVKDDSGYLLVFGTLSQPYNEGDVIPAGFSGKYSLYNGLPEMASPTGFAASTENTGTVTPTETTVELLSACDLNEYVYIKNAKYDGTNFTDDGVNTIALNTNNYSGVTFAANKTYDIKGFYSIYSGKYQLTVISATEKPIVADLEVSPAFGDIAIGETITISCATEGATLFGYIQVGEDLIDLEGQTMPYCFIVKAEDLDKTIEVGVYAEKTDWVSSAEVNGTYTVVAPTPAEAVFQNGAGETVTGGEVPFGDYINFSWEAGCSAELYINNELETQYDTASSSGSWYVSGEKYAVGDEVTLKVVVINAYDKTSTATATFTVMSPYEIRDVVTAENIGATSGYNVFKNILFSGAEYAGRCTKNIGLQIGSSTNAIGTSVYMTQSVGVVDKIILDINASKCGSGAKVYVYGKNTPYEAYSVSGTTKPSADEAYAYDSDASKIGNLIEGQIAAQEEPYTINNPGYKYIIVVANGTIVFDSLTFVWDDPYVNASDVTYTMEGNVSNLTAGKFITLIDTTNGKSVSRKAAADGTIAGANAAIASVDGKMTLDLKKGQNSIDEFELVSATDGFKLLGGVLINRRYLAYDDNGLYTTTDADKAATVTFEVYGANLVVKFAENQYLVSDGTNFGKGAISPVVPMSLDDSATKVPAYVFVAPSNITTGVDEVEVADDATAPVRYYNLNGVEVNADNLVPGIYIIRQGDKASKQLVR